MQAVCQALHPMHLETSMSLATSPLCVSRALGAGVVVAERRLISRDMVDDISCSLNLFHLHEEGLGFRGKAVAIAHRCRQVVGHVALAARGREAPVNGHAHVVDGLAIDLHGLDALGHHGGGLDEAALGADLHMLAGLDAQFLGQRLADFHELLGLNDVVQLNVLGPVVEVLDQAVRRVYVDFHYWTKHVQLNNIDRKSTLLNSSHQIIPYAVFCLKKNKYTSA